MSRAFRRMAVDYRRVGGCLCFMHYNFCRIHQTLRVTPAMEAGVADHVWNIEEMVDLLEQHAQKDAA